MRTWAYTEGQRGVFCRRLRLRLFLLLGCFPWSWWYPCYTVFRAAVRSPWPWTNHQAGGAWSCWWGRWPCHRPCYNGGSRLYFVGGTCGWSLFISCRLLPSSRRSWPSWGAWISGAWVFSLCDWAIDWWVLIIILPQGWKYNDFGFIIMMLGGK